MIRVSRNASSHLTPLPGLEEAFPSRSFHTRIELFVMNEPPRATILSRFADPVVVLIETLR
jgi:hypothetical protein